MRVFPGISEVHQTFHQVAAIITNMSNMCPSKTSILEGIEKLKKLLRIHIKLLSDALALSTNNCLRRWPPAALRGFRIAGVPFFAIFLPERFTGTRH